MRHQHDETIHPGSPRYLRKGQKDVLVALGKRPCKMPELVRSLFGREGTQAQARKLVATLATLMAQGFALRSGAAAFKLSPAGRVVLANHDARQTAKTNGAGSAPRARRGRRFT